MAPEQIEGKKVIKLTDIYALGLILYEMVTGEHAFPADTPQPRRDFRIRPCPQSVLRQAGQNTRATVAHERAYCNADGPRTLLQRTVQASDLCPFSGHRNRMIRCYLG